MQVNLTPAGTKKPGALSKASVSVPAAWPQADGKCEKLDRLELSRQALKEMQERQKRHQEELERMKKDAEAARENAEAMADAFKVMMLCMKIASRIMDGDRVPPEDEQYLLEHDPKMYQMAKSACIPKEDPEKHDSLLESEEESGGGAAAAGTPFPADPAGPEAAQPAEGGECVE